VCGCVCVRTQTKQKKRKKNPLFLYFFLFHSINFLFPFASNRKIEALSQFSSLSRSQFQQKNKSTLSILFPISVTTKKKKKETFFSHSLRFGCIEKGKKKSHFFLLSRPVTSFSPLFLKEKYKSSSNPHSLSRSINEQQGCNSSFWFLEALGKASKL
jgi:hypothetical protein